MRNFRTAAVASATAFAVAFGTTTLAAAEENQPADATSTTTTSAPAPEQKQGSANKNRDPQGVLKGPQDGDKSFSSVIGDGTKGLFSGQGSSQYFDDSKKPFFVTDAFGKETNIANVPQWARWWVDSTVVTTVAALIGAAIGGYNYAAYNGWVPAIDIRLPQLPQLPQLPNLPF